MTTPTDKAPSEVEKYEEKIAALQKQLNERNEATKVWIQADTQTRAYANQLERKLAAHAERVRGMAEALRGVIRVADRKTVEFDAAREALAAYASKTETNEGFASAPRTRHSKPRQKRRRSGRNPMPLICGV